MLHYYRRHAPACAPGRKHPETLSCPCPLWADGFLEGKRYRRSLATRSLEVARRRVARLEMAASGEGPPIAPAVSKALDAYFADCTARGVRESTLTAYRRTLVKGFAPAFALLEVSALRADHITEWRAARGARLGTSRTELQHIRTFLHWCVDQGWLAQNPAKKVRSIKLKTAPTMPYTATEVSKLLRAASEIGATHKPGIRKRARARARALLLTMLYGGLRISDVAVLKRAFVTARTGYLLLPYQTKTGVPLRVKLPPDCLAALDAVERESEYFFWTGNGKVVSVKNQIQRTLTRLGQIAGIHAAAHRFRDTFAVALLDKGADIRTVSLLLGHTSVTTTEKHYAPFVASTQKLLDRATARLKFA